MALAWINVIIEEELFEREFVANWCHGFEALRERARQYRPETVADITWCGAEDIRAAARAYAQSKPATIAWGTGIDHIDLDTARDQSQQVLTQFQEHPDSWTRVPFVLEQSPNPQSKVRSRVTPLSPPLSPSPFQAISLSKSKLQQVIRTSERTRVPHDARLLQLCATKGPGGATGTPGGKGSGGQRE